MSEFSVRVPQMDEEIEKMKVITNSLIYPGIVSFGGGAPAVEAYPIETLRVIANDVFSNKEEAVAALKYGSALGNEELRKQISEKLLATRGLEVSPENIMITAGGIQPMNLIAQLFTDPGDTILVESPSFVHVAMIWKMFQTKLVPCKMDGDGLNMEDVEEKIRKHHPKLIYTVPTFHNPTGVTMSLEKRKKLAELAAKYDVVVVEDDPYREIRYSGETLPYIKSFDTSGNVILTNSFSKIFSPGARLGYLVAEKKYLDNLENVKLGTDTCTNGISQALAAEFFKRGYYPSHLKMLCDMYRTRRDALLEAIDESFPEGTVHTMPDGGYYTWVTLPEELDAAALQKEINEKLNICYGEGRVFYTEGNPEGAGHNCVRLNFSGLREDVIAENARKLGQYFTEALAKIRG